MDENLSSHYTITHGVPAYMKRTARVKTAEQVRADFNRIGRPIAVWARKHGYTSTLVYEVLRGRILCKRGKSHEIAVLLGMKDGEIEHRQAA